MINKKLYILLILLFFGFGIKAQRHELGIQLGMSNLVGDIGRSNYILQKPILKNFYNYGLPFYGGILYRMNFNPYQTVRLNLGYSHIQFDDAYAKETYRQNRKLWGTNSIYHADLLFEYNFLPVNNEQKSMLSPYIFGGVGAALANVTQLTIVNDFNRDAAGNAIAPTYDEDFKTTPSYSSGRKMAVSVPFGAGLKYKFNYNWAVSGEFIFRPTMSDEIDYSQISNKNIKTSYNKDIPDSDNKKSLLQTDPYLSVAAERASKIIANRQIGNINSKDWVNSVTLSLTYSFGRPPCYCE